MYLLTHSLSPVLVLVVVMGSMELKIARLFYCSFSDSHSLCSGRRPGSYYDDVIKPCERALLAVEAANNSDKLDVAAEVTDQN